MTAATATEVVIDAREWLPPEPMEQTLAALRTLEPGQVVVLKLYREPFPLYRILDHGGWRRHTSLEADGTYVIRIHRP